MIHKYERSERLSHLWQGLKAYRQQHGGSYPQILDQDFRQRYLGAPDSISWPGFELVYTAPHTPSPEEVLAYWWPLVDRGTRLLFADGEERWIEARDNGKIVNPRNGRVVRSEGEKTVPATQPGRGSGKG